MLKSRGFYRYLFTNNVDQVTTAFHPLCWLKSVLLSLENYLAANRIGLETLNLMLLFSQSSQLKSTTERFWGSTWFIHFDGPAVINNIRSFQTQSGTNFCNHGKYCLPDQGNVWHHTKKFTETGLDPFIKYHIRPFFAEFCCREGISCLNLDINDSRDRSLGKKLKWKQRSFLLQITIIYRLFFIQGDWIRVSKQYPRRFLKDIFIFWEIECYGFLNFFETNSIQDGVKT